MFDRILSRFREKIRSRQYIMTHHAKKEMVDDALTIYDVEHGILTGKIIERLKDRIFAEKKYRMRGETPENDTVEVIAKSGLTGKLVIITVYKL